MTSFLFRSGVQLEARIASSTLWSSGKRKRGEWVCRECKRGCALRQRRTYSDGAWGIGSGVSLYNHFPAQEHKEDGGAVSSSVRNKATPPAERDRARPAAWGAESTAVEREDRTEAFEDVYNAEDKQNALWEQMERLGHDSYEDAAESTSEASITPSTHEPFQTEVPYIDYAANFDRAVLEKNPDMVARCLLTAERSDDLPYIRAISEVTFSECIEMLQPCNMIEQVVSAHIEMSEVLVEQLGIVPVRDVASEYSRMLMELVAIRRSVGLKPSLADYHLLLRAARDLGQRGMANKLWRFMLSDGLTPNTSCYNNYMAATIWDGQHIAVARQNVRVTPFHMLARRFSEPRLPFSTYRVGDSGVKSIILQFFGEMLKTGAIADEESYRMVITAAAREGDMETVKGVLKRVWDIDVDYIQQGQTADPPDPRQDLQPPSRDVPSSKLLFTIAHAFGINNDVPTALRLVDLVARHHNLVIDDKTWDQLQEWTFVLATPRTGTKSRTDGTRTGQLPLPSVLSLWDTMTNAPYNVRPSIGMYDRLIRNLRHRQMTGLLVEKMYEGFDIYRTMKSSERQAFQRLANAVSADSVGSAPNTPSGESLEQLRRQWEYLALLTRRNVFWLGRWVRCFLATTRSRARVDDDGEWALRNIPTILWEWRHWAPTVVRYEITAGTVEFAIRSRHSIDRNRERMAARKEEEAQLLEKVPLGFGERWARPGRARRKLESVKGEGRRS